MSQFVNRNIVCPRCNRQDTIRLWEEINATEDKTARNRLLDGSLFTHRCKKCKYTLSLAYNCIYKDSDRHFMVYLAADGDGEGMRKAMDKIEKDFNQLSPSQNMKYNITRRIVSTDNELREKVFIFEAGLDDRIIEIMKCFYMSAVLENRRDMEIAECLFVIGKNDQWSFEFVTPYGQVFSTPIKKDLYDEFKKEYEGYFGEENDYFVNSDYALDLYNRHEEDVDYIEE